jgi:hypothetical protein
VYAELRSNNAVSSEKKTKRLDFILPNFFKDRKRDHLKHQGKGH